jgi:hypothetical protein
MICFKVKPVRRNLTDKNAVDDSFVMKQLKRILLKKSDQAFSDFGLFEPTLDLSTINITIDLLRIFNWWYKLIRKN